MSPRSATMKHSVGPLALALIVALPRAWGATYSRTDSVVGSAFNSFFQYQAISDPTHGFVTYVDQATAQSKNLTYASGDHFVLKADATSTLSASGAGRSSVRLMSNKQYSTHVAVFNMRHMPEGCGTWPAVWEVGDNWPSGGEVDIVEGVNLQSADQTTLHTSPGCTMPASGVAQSGQTTATDCNTAVNSNSGCSVQSQTGNSYGTGFNNAGGGIYAIERTNSFIKVWFWSAASGSAPSDAKSGASSVNTANWGTPMALFPNTNCDIASHFGPNNIIINLTFCGDWAGNVYSTSGCPSTCNAYVAANPTAFQKAYFDFASINIYQ